MVLLYPIVNVESGTFVGFAKQFSSVD